MFIKPTERIQTIDKKISKKHPGKKEGETDHEVFSELLEEIDIVELSSQSDKKNKEEQAQNSEKRSSDPENKETNDQKEIMHINKFA